LNKTFRTLVVFDKQINALVRLRFNNCWPLKMRAMRTMGLWERWATSTTCKFEIENENHMSEKSCLKNHVSKKSYVWKSYVWKSYVWKKSKLGYISFKNKFWKKINFVFKLNFIILL
jgi:hypothetical protein